ncbi:VOC family protein [Frankia sp. AgB1.8]|nr:VOC family protein [Frankia sp. AgB1.8]
MTTTRPSGDLENTRTRLRRMHHIAYVVKDQDATRRFYEDVVGLPLMAVWAEAGEFSEFPGRTIEFCHTFFGLGDGCALAFFAFADEDVYEAYKARTQTGFFHPAVAVSGDEQERMRERLTAAGFAPFEIDHGYCQSLYVHDPDGLVLEFTRDPDDAAALGAWQAETARVTLSRWLSGDRTPNNDLRRR